MREKILPSLRSTHGEDSVVLDIERFAIDYQLENGISPMETIINSNDAFSVSMRYLYMNYTPNDIVPTISRLSKHSKKRQK